MQSGDAGGVGLELAQLVGSEFADVGDAVGVASAVELAHALELGLVGGDDDLATALGADAVLVAEGVHALGAGDGHAGLGGAGSVVEAGVDDAGVVAALVPSDAGFLLECDDAEAVVSGGEGHGGGESEDAGSDDGDVGCVGGVVRHGGAPLCLRHLPPEGGEKRKGRHLPPRGGRTEVGGASSA